ncbi:NEW3 domain-containing protein [Streptomyces sp. NPDC020917]|uniref:NEW3 domain-containing protein n=1 Tax=Streptomyces sp. NPDC020917 TaxID=3365102 RepID=UPI0037A2F0E9
MRNRVTPGPRLTAYAVAAALVAAPLLTLAPTPAVAAAPLRITAGYLSIGLSTNGLVTSLVDLRTGTNYLAPGKSAPLVSVVADGRQDLPTSVKESAHGTLVFKGAKATVKVKEVHYPTYSTLEVIGLTPAPGVDVETLLWGPLPTDVSETVGQDAGVVSDRYFALGLHPLNDKTVGAWPQEFDSSGFGSDVLNKPYGEAGSQNDWAAGAKTPWGSMLRAYTYDYSKTRIRAGQIPLGPLAGPEGQIVGSKLALFGTSPDMVLSVSSQIARGQGLPYPTINGQWEKTAEATRQPFLSLADLSTGNLSQYIGYAKQAGIKNVYSVQGAAGPWTSTGHYQFNANFGGSDAAAAQMVSKATADGMRVGVHTLSDFITANDPYITSADPRLAVGETVKLTRPLAATDTTLYADGDSGGGGNIGGSRLRIGDEFVTFSGRTKVSDTEWQFTGLKRGQWSSAAKSYPAGTPATRINEDEYGGATGSLPIIDEIATRLATAYNTTGIRDTSYDGLESASWSGWGGQGMAHMVNGVYRQLASKDGFISEAANPSSNTWDAQSRISWGGLGWSDSNYDQVTRNVNFYRANYLPAMAGSLPISGNDSTVKIETEMARAASLGARFGWYQTSASSLANGSNTGNVLHAIKVWDSATSAGAFTPAQQKLMADQSTYWHLGEVTADRQWSLQQVDASGNPIGPAQTVTASTPAFTTTGLPALAKGKLYEARVATNSPGTVRYSVTRGSLPAGLTLNPDTGGITGIPKTSKDVTFTVTGKGGPGVADAQRTFTTGTVGVAPEAMLTAGSGVVSPGGSVTMTAVVLNPGTTTMSGVTATLGLPSGWTTSTATVDVGTIAAGAAAMRSWTVHIPAGAAPGTQTSVVSVSYPKGPGSTGSPLVLTVAHPSLAATFNNDGISDDSNPAAADFDGGGRSISAQTLAAAGLTPGAQVRHDGLTFTWPSTTPGTPDNASAGGQAIAMTGQGTTLGFLASGAGNDSGTGTITYTDGTTQAYTLAISDWTSTTAAAGSDLLATLPRRNASRGGSTNIPVHIYAATVTLQPGKTIAYLTLPNATGMHIFSTAIG